MDSQSITQPTQDTCISEAAISKNPPPSQNKKALIVSESIQVQVDPNELHQKLPELVVDLEHGSLPRSGSSSEYSTVEDSSDASDGELTKLVVDGKSNDEKSKETVKNYLKYVALFALVVQNASLVLAMRYAKTKPGPDFTSSTAVVMAELVKLITCLCILFKEVEYNFTKFASKMHFLLIGNFLDTLKVAVPAFIYVIQNNLLYVALANLPAATYQVTYQSKILTTAVFSILMLNKDINFKQWFALVLLFIGVAIVQLDGTGTGTTNQEINYLENDAENSNKHMADREEFAEETLKEREQNQFLGFMAVILGCISSGFAGVYFEKILKHSGTNSGKEISLWFRNIQLGLFGSILGLLTALGKDGEIIFDQGWFYGYDNVTIFVILDMALGGLLVAVVIKYADNIMKGFACAISIVVSAIFAVFLFNFEITLLFCLGTAMVLVATSLYNYWK